MSPDRPRFVETHGGRIVDAATRHERVTVNVGSMSSVDAMQMVEAVLDGLNRAYGWPTDADGRQLPPLPQPKK